MSKEKANAAKQAQLPNDVSSGGVTGYPKLVNWLHDQLEQATRNKCKALEHDDMPAYEFHAGYFKALREVAKVI